MGGLPMAEFLQLANTFDINKVKQGKIKLNEFYASEKIDGIRCFWDGGISIGLKAHAFPWGSTDRVATGLWSRYGKPIMCPKSFTDGLPSKVCLDGELFLPNGTFEELNSIVRRHEPDYRWSNIVYKIFDLPSTEFYNPRKINNANMKVTLDVPEDLRDKLELTDMRFFKAYEYMKTLNIGSYAEILEQTLVQDQKHLDEMLDIVLSNNGEGLILKHSLNLWEPKRSTKVLKVKPFLDSEGVVVGVNPGKGKYEGMMGSLDVKWRNPSGNDVVFSLSGFTDAERTLTWELNKVITFKYRRLTDEGVPYEARYLRAC